MGSLTSTKRRKENDDALWKRLAERRVALPEDIKIIEYYALLGRHQGLAIIDAPDTVDVAKSSLNWDDIADVEYCPAITAQEFMKLRADILK